MLSATPLFGTIHSWVSNEGTHMCAINEERKEPVCDAETQKNHLDLREGNPFTHSMVDASATCRMNPLGSLGMDRSNLMRENLRVHGSLVYPGMKAREGVSMPLGYVSDLHYKPDVTLECRKPNSGYTGLYKNPPPGLQKAHLGNGGDALGLDRHVGPADKHSELGLNGASGYLRVPWMSPYSDTGMYPFLDSTKYAALNMYKASFMSQPSPYLPQHLTYQSLCPGTGGGGAGAGAERLFYMPHYPPTPMSSPLAPPMRIPTAPVATTALPPLVHCQDKSRASVGPRSHHESSAFGQQMHQSVTHSDRLHSSSKASRTSSTKGSASSCSSLPVDSSTAILMPSPCAASRHPQPPAPPPPPLIESTLDFQTHLPRGPPPSSSTSPSVSHPFYMSSMALHEHPTPARSANHKSKSKEGSSDHRPGGGERKPSKSPPKTTPEKSAQPTPTKDPADKPLDLSAKMDFGLSPNGFSPNLEALAKLGHSPTAHYGLQPNRELLRETLSPSTLLSTSSKPPERPEIISTLHSSWVVPGPSPAPPPAPVPGLGPALNLDSNLSKGSSVIKNKNLECMAPQQRSSSCPRIGESNNGPPANPSPTAVTSGGRPASASPSPNINAECPKPSPSFHVEKAPSYTSGPPGKPDKATKRPESHEVSYKSQHSHLENGHAHSQLYLPHNETFLSPSLAYGNRYLPYPVSDGMSLPHIPLPAKGPIYPHPVLLGSSSLYPPRLTPKHGLPYGIPSSHGEYLTYHDPQEMVHPLMSPHLNLDPIANERLEKRSRAQEKPRHNEDAAYQIYHTTETTGVPRKPETDAEKSTGLGSKPQSMPLASEKEKTVCIDLIQDGTDGGSQTAKHGAKKGDPTKPLSSESRGSRSEKEPELKQLLQAAAKRPAEPDRQPETCSKLSLPPAVCRERASPGPSQGEESPAESSPLPDQLEQQTLRCARTSGDRTSEQTDSKPDRRACVRHCTGLNKEAPENAPEDAPEDTESHEDDEVTDGHSSKNKRSSLAKRIANSSGYVGDRFKCVTTELYADSSKLSREQRALQMEVLSQEDSNLSQPAAYCERAMMRFSELELKAKEGGSAADRELEGGQHRRPDWECSQRLAALGDQARTQGVQSVCGDKRVPVLQRCAQQSPGRADRETREGGHTPPPEPPQSPPTADGRDPESPSAGAVPDRKRDHHRDEEEEEEEEEDGSASGLKRPRTITDDWSVRDTDPSLQHLLEEVKDLMVCIELEGLRLHGSRHLHQPRGLGEGRAPAPPLSLPPAGSGPQQAKSCLREVGRKVRGSSRDEGPTRKRSEVDRIRCDETLSNGSVQHAGRPEPTGPRALPRLSDKRQRLKEKHRDSDRGDPPPSRPRRHGDPDKPKGKRQCKTKHISLRERRRASQSGEEHKVSAKRSSRKRSASLSDCDSSTIKPCAPSPCPAPPQPPLLRPPTQPSPPPAKTPPPDTPASRPMPPEARRLIVNKNAGETLLQRAARLGYEEVVLYCLENRICDVNHRDNAGYCALHEACARGWLSIAQHLVVHGADINCSAQDGTRPLHDAVENDHLEVVRLLLSYGADPTLATYSGRGLLRMTHSHVMECFLSDYFADLQGRADDDPGLWDLYGSSVCEPTDDLTALDILADPPGPGDDDEDDWREREVFQFEFSDRPLLPCYNIQVSLSQGPRNWLLLSDVLKRLKMSARAFRAAFTHMEVATIAEAEFYKQASLSQLFSCPEELEGFLPNSKELLDLVEISGELVALLGSSLEYLDDHREPVAMAKL